MANLLPPVDLAWAKVRIVVDAKSSCWIWKGAKSGGPNSKWQYGMIRRDGRTYRAHRVVYELVRGRIPAGLVLDHLCRVTLCVNPDHLDAVPQRVNVFRSPLSPLADKMRQVACVHGHPLTGENLYVKPNGRRQCVTCRNIQMRRWAAKVGPEELRRRARIAKIDPDKRRERQRRYRARLRERRAS